MKKTEFEDIKIIDIDHDRSQKTLNMKTGRINVYYELSAKPPSVWVQIFMAHHGRGNLYRQFRATVSRKYIVLEMGTDEISRAVAPEYRPLLDQDVAETNVKYRQHIEKQALIAAANAAREKRLQDNAHQMLEDMGPTFDGEGEHDVD